MDLNHHTNSKTVIYDEEVSIDRLTKLPDALIHYIFSFMDKNEMLRTIIISKRCAELCFSSPYINLSAVQKSPHDTNHRSCDKSWCKSFKSFLENYRSKHGNNEVHSFRLNWVGKNCPCYPDGKSLIEAWLLKLSECNIQELSLDIGIIGHSTNHQQAVDDNVYANRKKFSLLGCEFLRVLEINLRNDVITLPLMVLDCLEVLSLNTASFDDSRCSIGEWISKYCPSLKKLSLVSIPKKFSVENDCLEDLAIKTESFTFVSVKSVNLKALSINFPTRVTEKHGYNYNQLPVKEETCVEVSAPNLGLLKWKGCLPQGIRFSKLVSLREATLDASRADKPCKDTLIPLAELLVCVRPAEVLRLNISVIEAMIVTYEGPILFENLHRLEINNCIGDTHQGNHIPLIANLISQMPKLRFLIIDCKTSDDFDKFYYMQRPVAGLLEMINSKGGAYKNQIARCQVKEVVIRLSDDSEAGKNGIFLAIYLLEAIIGLEKMTILYPLPFCDELPAFLAKASIASSQVTVLTMVDKGQGIEK